MARKLNTTQKEHIQELLSNNPSTSREDIYKKFPEVSKPSIAAYYRYLTDEDFRKTIGKNLKPWKMRKKVKSNKNNITETNNQKEVKSMALEDKDYKKIGDMVKNIAAEQVAEAVKDLPNKTASILEDIRKKREQENLRRQRELEEQRKREQQEKEAKELRNRLDVLEKKLKESPKRTTTGGGVFGTEHKTYEEFFNCPNCMEKFQGIVKKYGLPKVSSQLCGDDESCKVILKDLEDRGYKFESPKKEEVKNSESKEKETEKAGKGSETGHFSFGETREKEPAKK